MSFAQWSETVRGRSPAIEDLCRELLDEPLLPLSMGAKELFHSNLLAWMCRRFPGEARQVLAPWLTVPDRKGPDRVRREYRHLDLVVEFDRCEPLVIENKLTALPDEDQLARYTEHALGGLGDNPTLVLLSLANPGWPADRRAVAGRDWQYVSYGALATRIGSVFGTDTDFDRQVLVHEARLAFLLHEIAASVAVTSAAEAFQLSDTVTGSLAQIGLEDAVGKIRGAQVMRRIQDSYTRDRLSPSVTEVGLSRGVPLLSAYWRTGNGDSIGWQLQGRQWRLAMILPSLTGRTSRDIQARERHARTHQRWFDFEPLAQILGISEQELRARTVGGADAWQRFNPDFIYRYRLLPRDTTVDQVIALAQAYGHAAQQWEWDA